MATAYRAIINKASLEEALAKMLSGALCQSAFYFRRPRFAAFSLREASDADPLSQ